MVVKVNIPTALKQYAGDQIEIELGGNTVGGLLGSLTDQFPELKKHLYNDRGELRNFVNVYLNDEDIRYLKGEETAVHEGDEVMIVPAVAGGGPLQALESPGLDDSGAVELSKEEIERYSRHLLIPEVAVSGQKRLKQAKVLCVGTGGLGSPLAMYLAAAGVGRLGLVDFDVVDVTNLQRQILHGTRDIGSSKLQSAKETLSEINPNVRVDLHDTALSSENALEIFEPYDIVVDGTDNFPTRYLVNDACVLSGKPNVYGSIFRFEGQASVFWAQKGPCYRCLYPEPPPPGLVPSCAEGGVLGILPGIIGVIQATETVKLILGKGDSLIGRLLLFDALSMKFRELKLRRDPGCPICGENPTVDQLIDYEQFCGIGVGLEDEASDSESDIAPRDLKEWLDRGEEIFILDVREPHEFEICRIPGSTLIPIGQLQSRVGELDRDSHIVAHCRSGVRSTKAVKLLREAGFPSVENLAGGILAWSDDVDPRVPKY